EPDDAALVLCILVHPSPGCAIERHFIPVAGKEILAKIFPLLLEEKSQMTNNGIVAQDGMLLLGYIPDEPEHSDPDQDQDQAKDRAKTVGNPLYYLRHTTLRHRIRLKYSIPANIIRRSHDNLMDLETEINHNVKRALIEDIGTGDLT